MSNWRVVTEEPAPQTAPMQSQWKAVPYEDNQESAWKRIRRDMLIGLTHAGRNLHNLPHDIASGVDYVGSGIGRALGAKEFQNGQSNHLADYLPYDTQSYADVLGQKGQGTQVDNLIQKGIEYAPDVIGGINALRSMKILPHLTKRGATKKLNQAKKTFKDWSENGNSTGKLNINPELIEDARQFLPNTLQERHLLNNAANDYDKLFELQSQVGKVSAKRMSKLSSIFSPETRIKGEAGLGARRRLINSMHENLQSEGLHNTSNLFREGQNDFRKYMQFRPYRNAIALAGLGAVGNEVFPQNPLTDLIKKLMFHAAGH